MLPPAFTSAGDTHIGNVRPLNEDSYSMRPEAGLWLVADGMGGHARGDLASQMLCEAVEAINLPRDLDAASSELQFTVQQVNARLIKMRERDSRNRMSGTTFAAMIIRDSTAEVLWAGDSRVYQLRGNTFSQVTSDHSRVQELVNAGLLAPEKAANHPDANVVTRAVGAHEDLNIDTARLSLRRGDKFLLCSDGLYRGLSENSLARRLSTGSNPSAIVRRLMAQALAGTASDNLTCITVIYAGD